jgi:hypothetical protein
MGNDEKVESGQAMTFKQRLILNALSIVSTWLVQRRFTDILCDVLADQIIDRMKQRGILVHYDTQPKTRMFPKVS